MDIKSIHVSKYSTTNCQTVVIKTADGRTVEVDLFDRSSNFKPNSVRVKVESADWGFKLPEVVNFGYPED